MRLEDKGFDGLELERQRDRELTPLEREETDLPEHAHEQLSDVDRAVAPTVMDAFRGILARDRQVDVASLRLPPRETRALEALQAAVTGKKANDIKFVFAEDREILLEQALAILQPVLAQGDIGTAAAFEESRDDLFRQVSDLRAHIVDLEDAQDDFNVHERERIVEADAETEDPPEPPEDEDWTERMNAEPAFQRAPHRTHLTGPDAPARAPDPRPWWKRFE